MSLNKDIIIDSVPNHIAIIMDGNGRWAKKRNKSRDYGHKEGKKSVKKIVKVCAELGVKNLTLFAFSTENWNRPKQEVNALMTLLVSSIHKETKTLLDNDIKLQTIGNISKLPNRCQKELSECIDLTKENKSMTLILALSYSGKWEIINAVKNTVIIIKTMRNEMPRAPATLIANLIVM